jgi:hypothetical protein
VRTGFYGIAWDYVVVNGLLRIFLPRRGIASGRRRGYLGGNAEEALEFLILSIK